MNFIIICKYSEYKQTTLCNLYHMQSANIDVVYLWRLYGLIFLYLAKCMYYLYIFVIIHANDSEVLYKKEQLLIRDRNNSPNLWIAMSRLCTPRLYCGPMFAEK